MTTGARWLSGLAGVTILLGLTVGPVMPQLRFADKLQPYGNMIFGQSGPIDVVFLGTSRIMASVMGRQLQAELESRLQRPVVIHDLSKSGTGSDADYLLLRETLRRSSAKLVIIEYSLKPQQDNHFFFMQAATWRDILEASRLTRNPLSHFTHLTRSKLAMLMTQMGGERWFQKPAKMSLPVTTDFSTPRGPWEVRLHNAITVGRRAVEQLPIGEPENIVRDSYVRRSIELVKSQGGNAILITIPGLDQRPLPPAERERLKSFFGTDVIGLAEHDLDRFTPHHYADDKHHGWLAVDVYTPLLALWLAPRLAGTVTSNAIP